MKNVILIIRILFGALFIWSAVAKLKDPLSFADAIRNYQIVGDPLVAILALLIPTFELVAGIGVMWDRLVQGSSLLLTCSLIVFTFGILTAWARGLDITCGCFGNNELVNYPIKLTQNGLLLAAGVAICWWAFGQPQKPKAAIPAEA